MTRVRMLRLFVIIVMLLPIVQSCAGMKSWIPKKNSVSKPVSVKDPSMKSGQAPAPVKPTSPIFNKTSAQAVDLAKKHIEAGDYQKAIDIYNVECQKNPLEEALVMEYVKCIETIKSDADKALDKEDFASAGRCYNTLLQNDPHFKKLEKKLSFKSTCLNEKLSCCKKAIFKQGFQEYRKGNLSGAIALWQDLLAIDPHNKGIKEALRTAKLQQKNLQQKE